MYAENEGGSRRCGDAGIVANVVGDREREWCT